MTVLGSPSRPGGWGARRRDVSRRGWWARRRCSSVAGTDLAAGCGPCRAGLRFTRPLPIEPCAPASCPRRVLSGRVFVVDGRDGLVYRRLKSTEPCLLNVAVMTPTTRHAGISDDCSGIMPISAKPDLDVNGSVKYSTEYICPERGNQFAKVMPWFGQLFLDNMMMIILAKAISWFLSNIMISFLSSNTLFLDTHEVYKVFLISTVNFYYIINKLIILVSKTY
jgi:hypothetical protein